jgi:hypothetical protein
MMHMDMLDKNAQLSQFSLCTELGEKLISLKKWQLKLEREALKTSLVVQF